MTVKELMAEIKRQDADTAITSYFIMKLIKNNKIRYTRDSKRHNAYVIDFNEFVEDFNKLLVK